MSYNEDKTYKTYRKMFDKLHDEILGKDYIVADCCNNITGDEIIVNKVIEEYNRIKDSNNRLLLSTTILLVTILLLLIVGICIF